MTEAPAKLPMTPEEITTEWLAGVLNVPVKSSEITRTILDQSASKVYVTLTYEDGAAGDGRPEHICIKGGFNPVMMNMPGYKEVLKVLYANEINFFDIAMPKISNVELVKVWWTGVNDEQGQAIAIMDDLDAAGNTFGDPTQAWSVDMVKDGVVQLAGLHASTWGASAEGEYSALKGPYDFAIMQLAENWAMITGEDRPPVTESMKEQDRVKAALSKHLKTRNPKFISLTHSDPHCGNTWITKDGKPRFLDWQTTQISSVFHDLVYFVVGALTVEDRRKHEMEILEHYLEALSSFGGPKLGAQDEDVLVEYKKNMMSGVGWLLTPFEMQRKERVFAMCERYNAAMADHKMMELLEASPAPAAV